MTSSTSGFQRKPDGARHRPTAISTTLTVLPLLADNPRKGADRMHILPGLRRLIVGQPAAFYRMKDDHIRILRVLHQSMDSAAHRKNI